MNRIRVIHGDASTIFFKKIDVLSVMSKESTISHEQAVTSTYWGGKKVTLPQEYKVFFNEVFGIEDLDTRIKEIKNFEEKNFPQVLPKSVLSEQLIQKLSSINALNFTTDGHERFISSTGQSYLDILRKRNGKLTDIVDGVVKPTSIEAIQELVKVADEQGIHLLPMGGKSSVTQTLTPSGLTIAINMLDMNKIISFSSENELVEVEAGILLPDLENWLAEKNFQLGHSPQSFISTTIGGAIASRGAGQFSSSFGTMREMIHSLTVETPKGTFIDRINIVPESAAGPTLSELFVGSEGALGIITKATLRVKPILTKHFKAFLFKKFEDGISAIQDFYQKGINPATIRLSDELETEMLFRLLDKEELKNRLVEIYLNYRDYDTKHRCILFVYLEGEKDSTKNDLDVISKSCKLFHGISLTAGPAKDWYEQRYDLPFIRENFLEAGILLDTLETSATYDKLLTVHDKTLEAFKEYCPFVMCHLSHVYPQGASLYFTFVAIEDYKWNDLLLEKIRKAVVTGFIENGAAISHHHGVGIALKPYLSKERSELANGIIKAIKDYLDPKGIMNPSAGLLYDTE